MFRDNDFGLKVNFFQKEDKPQIAGRFKIPLNVFNHCGKQPHRLLVLVAQCGSYTYTDTLFSDIVSFEGDILIKDDFAIGVFTFNIFSYVACYEGRYYIHMSIDQFVSGCIEFNYKHDRLSVRLEECS